MKKEFFLNFTLQSLLNIGVVKVAKLLFFKTTFFYIHANYIRYSSYDSHMGFVRHKHTNVARSQRPSATFVWNYMKRNYRLPKSQWTTLTVSLYPLLGMQLKFHVANSMSPSTSCISILQNTKIHWLAVTCIYSVI